MEARPACPHSLKDLVAVAVIGLDVCVDLVDSCIQRISDIRAVGDVSKCLFKDLGNHRITRGDRTDKRLTLGQTEEDLKLATRGVVCGHCGGGRS